MEVFRSNLTSNHRYHGSACSIIILRHDQKNGIKQIPSLCKKGIFGNSELPQISIFIKILCNASLYFEAIVNLFVAVSQGTSQGTANQKW